MSFLSKSNIERARQRPFRAWQVLLELTNGQYYRIKFRVLGRRVIVGKRFRVRGRLDIRGPGTVIFGDDCVVLSTRIAPTTPCTQSRQAVIRFGNHVALNGARFSCKQLINVGDNAMIAGAKISDSDFHDIEVKGGYRINSTGISKPVVIGPNAWICAGAMVLKGVRIGDNAVVSAGAVVAGRVPPNGVVFGNPARLVWRVNASKPDPAPVTVPVAKEEARVQKAGTVGAKIAKQLYEH